MSSALWALRSECSLGERDAKKEWDDAVKEAGRLEKASGQSGGTDGGLGREPSGLPRRFTDPVAPSSFNQSGSTSFEDFRRQQRGSFVAQSRRNTGIARGAEAERRAAVTAYNARQSQLRQLEILRARGGRGGRRGSS